ncbi:MAG: hypothetical protein KJ666_15695 [Bacteroidetes bacterium]|nr:hypothetical protein [Bacteroidota bacterium]MBU2585047.1 hypothetical protein [Bacteroidota bacterium]
MLKTLTKSNLSKKKKVKIPDIWNRVAGLLRDRKREIEVHTANVRKEWTKLNS